MNLLLIVLLVYVAVSVNANHVLGQIASSKRLLMAHKKTRDWLQFPGTDLGQKINAQIKTWAPGRRDPRARWERFNSGRFSFGTYAAIST